MFVELFLPCITYLRIRTRGITVEKGRYLNHSANNRRQTNKNTCANSNTAGVIVHLLSRRLYFLDTRVREEKEGRV